MTTRRAALSAISLIALAAGPAYALKPGTHADITYAACIATGLPRDFCTRTATEDYNTDSREWDDLGYSDDVLRGLFHKNAERVLGFMSDD